MIANAVSWASARTEQATATAQAPAAQEKKKKAGAPKTPSVVSPEGFPMNCRSWLVGALVPVVAIVPALAAPTAQVAKTAQAGDPASRITWHRYVLDTKFRSEGVAVADVNKDGKLDIIAGDVWY